MKASILKKPFEITIEEVPTPVPKPDELLIQVKASAICGSDMKAYEGKHPLITPYHSGTRIFRSHCGKGIPGERVKDRGAGRG